jgi:hypothetical protein
MAKKITITSPPTIGTSTLPYGTITTGTTGTTMNPSIWANPYSSSYSKVLENETKVLDIEKILLIEDKKKRKILLKLIMNYSRCDNSEIEKLLKNTLESYNLIIEQKALERKIKITSLMNDDVNK